MSRQAIALFGGSAPRPGESLYALAYEIGCGLAEAGFDLINGGHDGTMEAASRGARESGARVTGVTCVAVRQVRGVAANPHVHEVIDVPALFERIEIMIRRAAGYVVLPGGTGTLAELALAWEHVSKAFIAPRPIVCVGAAWKPIIDAVSAAQSGAEGNIIWADTPDQVVRIISESAIEVAEHDRNFLPTSAGK